ncbi:helix-turn-helix domain-containing protein [Paenibacillus mesophilus]|uniref:AraC family transcriptional regulator n=1 Tax=Paenibacillus mesophilus TaxID=2582849 RepID=UPI00110DD5D8|nr:AraC family transcriptional regulator [Paenibacillus mesophilus]TMV52850.1 helix-turn-helix domain-containing protein [Paenibacillus mesophilus]
MIMSSRSPLVEKFVYRYDRRAPPDFQGHPKYELLYVHEGGYGYVIGASMFDVTAGDLLVMNGITPHGPIFREKSGCVRTGVAFYPASLQSLQDLPDSIDLLYPFRELRNCHCRLTDPLRTDIEQLLSRMNRYYGKQDRMSYNRFRAAFLELLLIVSESCGYAKSTYPEPRDAKEKLVRQALDYIGQHYMTDLSLDIIAERLYMSRSYLAKIFKEYAGMTVFEYINDHRINRAKVLFATEKSKSISEVCYEVGFKNPAHFSRNFKSTVGATPEEYRNTI